MPAHSIGSATISFGLVSVPIKMFSAGESSAAISFNWLHKKDGARLKQQYVCPKVGGKKAELDMAVQLIEQAATETFEPKKYEDTVKARIQEQIQRKVDGEEITEEPTEAPKTQIIDLMEALKASLAKGKGSTGGERKPAKRAERAAETKPAKRRKAASA